MSTEVLYLFTGTAEVFINNRINIILNELGSQTYSITKYDLEQTSIKTIIEDALTPPFLEDYKVIILKNPTVLTNKGSLSDEYKILYNYLKKPNPTTILIINAVNITPVNDNELYKELKKYVMIIDYSNQEDVEIAAWVKRTLEPFNIQIDNQALDTLLEYTNNDQIRLINETNKLIDYVGNNGLIDKQMIVNLVTKDLSNEIFVLIKAIIAKDKDEIFRIFRLLTSKTKDIQGIFALITYNLNDLYTISKLLKKGYSQVDIAKFLNISSGRAYYLIKDMQSFTPQSLEEIVIKLADLDYQIKSGQIDKTTGLELLLLKL